jgi:hypothetical protein
LRITPSVDRFHDFCIIRATSFEGHRRRALPESKRDAFTRLAERRTTAALDRIRVIGNLSNPYAYEYTDDDVRLIFSALEQELKAARAKFHTSRRRQFKLG